VARLRRQGKRVLLHCAAGQSRTAIVAARYAVLISGSEPADSLADVLAVIPSRRELVNPDLYRALLSLGSHR
jgi:protein-tyrosine phosphatase